jgi:hypothetical protein
MKEYFRGETNPRTSLGQVRSRGLDLDAFST